MVPSMVIKMMCIPLSKRVATMPSLWFRLLFPSPVCFLSHQVGHCCVPSNRLLNNRWLQWRSIHPPWCDCFYLGADIVILSTFSIPSALLRRWVTTNPHSFRLWHKLIGCWLVVMLLGSSQRSSLVRQLVIPPMFCPVHLVCHPLQAFRPLFWMKFFSFRSSLLSVHVPLSYNAHLSFWNHYNPLAYLRPAWEGESKG